MCKEFYYLLSVPLIVFSLHLKNQQYHQNLFILF